MLHRVLSTSCYKRCGGHHALDFIRLKWQKFRFQFLLRQNVANYVYVADYVLKYAYFHLLSLKTRKHDFLFSEFMLFSESWKMSLTSKQSWKPVVSSVVDQRLQTVWRPWCTRPYSLEMTKILNSNFTASKCCKLCICNCSCV